MLPTIEQQIKSTYFTLRIAAAVIGFALPLLLWGGGKLVGFSLRESMSAYYWANAAQPSPSGENADGSCNGSTAEIDVDVSPSPEAQIHQPGTMRNWFVGLLFAIGMILYINKGHSPKEDWALNFAGLFAVGVALFPMPWDCGSHLLSLHGIAQFHSFYVSPLSPLFVRVIPLT
jgi:hypothetical protein